MLAEIFHNVGFSLCFPDESKKIMPGQEARKVNQGSQNEGKLAGRVAGSLN